MWRPVRIRPDEHVLGPDPRPVLTSGVQVSPRCGCPTVRANAVLVCRGCPSIQGPCQGSAASPRSLSFPDGPDKRADVAGLRAPAAPIFSGVWQSVAAVPAFTI